MKKPFRVVITDSGFEDIERERAVLEAAGATLHLTQCKTPVQVIEASRDADALLVQWAPVPAEVIQALTDCKVIVRYGIGVDNVDLQAAKAHGIPVCNVPDYCIDEVADHAMGLALALARQLPQIDRRVRKEVWKITPDLPMPAFRQSTFATAGFGRVARAVQDRARGFRFRLIAYDPFVPDQVFKDAGVEQVSLEELFREADILSLHVPYSPETHHLVNQERLLQMKSNAILVNTARGALVDTLALAEALSKGIVGGAGIDVFEEEPLPHSHHLRTCPNALLTSHAAWYSEASVPLLQQLAAEEVVRGLRGEPFKNQVNI